MEIQATVRPATASAAVATLNQHSSRKSSAWRFASAKNAAGLIVQSSKDIKFSSKVFANGDDC